MVFRRECMRIFSLLAFFLVLISDTQAAECLVVSGLEKDTEHAFVGQKIFTAEVSAIAGKKCHVFNNWKELSAFAQSRPKGSELLIAQGAHGMKTDEGEVRFDCNAGTPSADEVLKSLQNLSQSYKVAAVIQSCYSGEIMKKKLIQDHLQNDGLENLCLYTSSSVGRVSTGSQEEMAKLLEGAKAGDTLEDLFMKTRAGMISSAAWEEVGLPSYLQKKDLTMGLSVIQKMDKVTRGPSCDDVFQANMALCVAPKISDEIYEDLMSFMDPYVPEDAKWYFVDNMKRKTKNISSPHGRRCLQGILDFYQKRYGDKLENMHFWTSLDKVEEIIPSETFYPDCVAYKKTLKSAGEQESLLTDSFTLGRKQYKESIERLKKRYTKRKFDQTFDLKDFARAAANEAGTCAPSSKQKIIDSFFGDDFFPEELESTFGSTFSAPHERVQGFDVSTQQALKGFQRASLKKENMLDPKDAKRRKACRDFKL